MCLRRWFMWEGVWTRARRPQKARFGLTTRAHSASPERGTLTACGPVPSLPPHVHMHDAAATLSTLAGTLLLGTLLRATDVLPRGASRTLLSLCAQLTLPALLLHTLPPALDVALDTPAFALLPLVGLAHLLAVAVRERVISQVG